MICMCGISHLAKALLRLTSPLIRMRCMLTMRSYSRLNMLYATPMAYTILLCSWKVMLPSLLATADLICAPQKSCYRALLLIQCILIFTILKISPSFLALHLIPLCTLQTCLLRHICLSPALSEIDSYTFFFSSFSSCWVWCFFFSFTYNNTKTKK